MPKKKPEEKQSKLAKLWHFLSGNASRISTLEVFSILTKNKILVNKLKIYQKEIEKDLERNKRIAELIEKVEKSKTISEKLKNEKELFDFLE